MVVNKHKKNRRLRGSRTYGWGSPKKHRGKGSRGGVGNAGMGKRGQHKMSLLNSLGIKNLGSHGFVRPRQKLFVKCAINLVSIEANVEKWLAKKIAIEEKGIIIVDLEKAGFDKVLGSGNISRKMIINAPKFSAGAKKKIEAAGGKAEGEIIKEEKEAKKDSPKEAHKAKVKAKDTGKKAPKEKAVKPKKADK
ncbi:MAG: uL15 family ribosomal protein [Nanoarchaeota archaeon]|nr:50S ribosomal protein L15 [Nanoarchaeota archaeon]MBU4300761.1 50S ribosomal protein L15 [Nanoarchaeota archaeon]MBU4452371.1 50S ribosomal protein L15 [Nanoarchaeota archaeon]MCG2723353.1 50S ribosomal protein L15 [archaeon]